MKLLDTIAAISTPRGKGGVAMIRISGDNALNIGDAVFFPRSKKKLSEYQSGKMAYGEIVMWGENRERYSIDDGLAVTFRAPASFTVEDTVEIYCHGGSLVTQKVLSCVLSAGARAAEAGEFTRRAFVNGKMSLNEAQSLGFLLEAKNDGQLRVARGGMRGNLDKKTREIYESLRDVMTNIFAVIDFPDEDLSELSRDQMISLVSGAKDKTDSLISTYGTGRAVIEGIPTVICGRTNAGKSSVYNMILGYDAAIVTDIEGTTRDILREQATLGSTTLLLCDTAGIRKTADTVESIGIDRALTEIDTASLVLAVFDASGELCEDDLSLINTLKDGQKTCIALLNKSDLLPNERTVSTLKAAFEHVVFTSANKGEGSAELGSLIDKLFIDGNIDIDNDAIVTGARQYAALKGASGALCDSLEQLKGGVPLDLCCIGIEAAMSAIGEVDGREIGEDIVAEIFSKFCVGK